GADAFHVDTAGYFYVRAADRGRPAGSGLATLLIRISPLGEVLDSIPMPTMDPADNLFTIVTAEGPLYPFVPFTSHAWSPHGHLVTGRHDAYSFEIMRADGTVHVERAYTPVRLSVDERRQ